jgi:WD40 repeat protein
VENNGVSVDLQDDGSVFMNTTRYRAFISYSRKDRVWGARLHRWLETYQLPSGIRTDIVMRRLGRFFRDEDEMPAVADILARVRQALDESESLIVICSPHSAQSKWVAAEIEYFRETGRQRNIFAFIVDGQPNSEIKGMECFPPPFRRSNSGNPEILHEPSGVDVRNEGRTRACARLVAGLLGINFDDLWQRERRRATARQRRWIGGLSVASVTFAGLAVAAVKFALNAQKNSKKAEAARAKLLADTSRRYLEDGNTAEALGFAVAALEIAQSGRASADALAHSERATRQALIAHQIARARLAVSYRGHEGRVTCIATSVDKRFLSTAGDDGVVRIYDYVTGTLLKVVNHQSPVTAIFFFDNDRFLLSGSKDGELKATNIEEPDQVFRVSLGTRLIGMWPSPNHDVILVSGVSENIAFWYPLAEKLSKVEVGGPTLSIQFFPNDPNLAFLDQGTKGALLSLREQQIKHKFKGNPAGTEIENGLISFADNGLEVFDVYSDKVVSRLETKHLINSVLDSRAGRIVTNNISEIGFWSLDAGTKLASQNIPRAISGIVKASVTNRLVVWTDNGASVYSLDDGQLIFQIAAKFEVLSGDVSDATGRLLLRGRDGRAGVWSLVDGVQLKLIEGHAEIRDARFSDTGRSVWIGRESGEFQIVALEENLIEGRFFHSDAILGWQIYRDNTAFLTWSADGTAKRWNWQADSGHVGDFSYFRAEKIAVNSDASIVYATQGNMFYGWRPTSSEPVIEKSIEDPIANLLPSNNGKGVMLSASKRVCALNIENGEFVFRDLNSSERPIAYGNSSFALYDPTTHKISVIDTAHLADGFFDLADDSVDVFLTGELKALAVIRANNTIQLFLDGSREPITTVTLAKDVAHFSGGALENRFLTVAADGSITVFYLDESLTTLVDIWVPPVIVPMDQITKFNQVRLERHILFVGNAGKLMWLDPDNRTVIRDETSTGILDWITLSPDGRHIVTPRDRQDGILLFDRFSQTPVKLEHGASIVSVQFLPGGEQIASWSADHMLKVWKANGSLVREIPHFGIVRGVTATPTDNAIVSWTDTRDLVCSDVETGASIFEMRTVEVVREVRFLDDPPRMVVEFNQHGPIILPYVSRVNLGDTASDLLSLLRPFSQTERDSVQKPPPLRMSGFRNHRKGSPSVMEGHDLLSGWRGAVELAILRDGGVMLVSDQAFNDIIRLAEYNDFDQLLSLYAFDGSMARMAIPIPANFLDSIRRQNRLIIYTLFPDHPPIGYAVPLTKQY